MEAFDLAERFQTPVFVMMRPRPRHEQLDVGRRSSTRPSRSIAASVLDAETLKQLGEWGRYKDVDGDGIPYRTVPGDGMPAYFTRGSGHNEKAQYSERPDDYVDNMDRLARKFETARDARARSRSSRRSPSAEIGIIAYGTTHWAIDESRDQLREETGRRDRRTSGCARIRSTTELGDVHRRARARLRRRAEPRRADAAADEAGAARRAQSRKLRSVLHYNGLPIDARSVTDDILAQEGLRTSASDADDARSDGRRRTASGQDDRHGRRQPASQEDQPHRPRAADLQGGKTTLCAGCGHNAISERIIDAFYEMGVDPEAGHQAVGHRLLEQEPGLLPGRLARLQRRPRPHAVGRHRRDARQPAS